MDIEHNLHAAEEISTDWQQYVDRGEFETALLVLDAFLLQFPEITDLSLAWVYALKARTYLMDEQYRRATKWYIGSLRLWPNSYVSHEGLADSLSRLGKLKWAEAWRICAYHRAIENAQFLGKSLDSIDLGDYESASNYLSAARWNILESQRIIEVKKERIRVIESIVSNKLHSMFGETEAERILHAIQG